MSEKDTNFNFDVRDINIEDFDYMLPDERIAKFPLAGRDRSKLLVYRKGEVSESVFARLPELLPTGSLIVFNNTRVIRARLLFTKETGAHIEIFCLEPDEPRDYAQSFQSRGKCQWICLVGNLKRWKSGTLTKTIRIQNKEVSLTAERLANTTTDATQTVVFCWDEPSLTFAEILEAAGVLPIPPYLHRDTEQSDLQTYQTVYSKIKGSVAAPTAGLHFTPEVLNELDRRGFHREELTLHVGAGTFKPVQTSTIGEHEMHSEFFSVERETLSNILAHLGNITAVGTTSVRTLESLYHLGCSLTTDFSANLTVPQWRPYINDQPDIPPAEALQNIINYLDSNNLFRLNASTRIIIVPGYRFRIVNNMITNFHQPKSTLLLLISAFVGDDWTKVYNYALTHDFRFLSYGDSSLLYGQ
ncbi:MAG: S-adenosylmethionine:tRNA ribosyltransferase-isomerase [Tannerella sp.]|jgi:S-adenosylmethionine:tRNA ribosyltransferase-isomerase|nr:S-adenosylmethionine:tRNA ribosyltransferase-isomerase [Tannerella sp.]